MLKSDLVQTDKHSKNDLLCQKNLRFLSRTNLNTKPLWVIKTEKLTNEKKLLLLLTVIISINCYSQISYEKGYYIDNSNQKINCLIKNIDWKNNPINIEYKLLINGESKSANIKSIKEFGIYNISKYTRSTVKIDRSSDNINNLRNDKNPLFNEEEHFLKVLVEGKANLYVYEDGNLIRYFYNKENSYIEQLVFKKYRTSENKLEENNQFKQQLWTNLKCPTIKMDKFEDLEYNNSSLINLFIEYIKCNNSDFIKYGDKQKKDLFNLTFRPRFNNSSLTIQGTEFLFGDTDFGSKFGVGFGIEAEYILPFNKNKWAILIEPTFQNFKTEKITDVSSISGGKLIVEVDYNSIELPISLRHYFFLNNNSKIFANISYIIDVSYNSSIEYKRADNSNLNSLEIETRNNFAFGIGYKLHDKHSLEIRYQVRREVIRNYIYLNSDYKTLSLIFGYSIF